MKRFVYVAALALGGLSHAAGCVITTGSDADIDILWTIDGEFDDGDGCATLGGNGVEVVTERVSTGARDIFIFDCSAGGVTLNLPLGDYDVWANAIDGQDRLLGQSLTVEVDLNRSGELVELPELAFRNGHFTATWRLTDNDSGSPVSCSEVGVGGVSVLTTLAGSGGTAFDDIFGCPASAEQGDITTGSLPLGDYSVDLSVLESGTDEPLSDAVIKDGTIPRHRAVEDLGIYEFFFL